jgi:hypothetical protein
MLLCIVQCVLQTVCHRQGIWRPNKGGQAHTWASFVFAFYPVSHISSLQGSRLYPTLLQWCFWWQRRATSADVAWWLPLCCCSWFPFGPLSVAVLPGHFQNEPKALNVKGVALVQFADFPPVVNFPQQEWSCRAWKNTKFGSLRCRC